MRTKTHHRHSNGHAVTGKIRHAADNTLDRLDATVDNLQRHTQRYSKQMGRYVTTHPNKSVGLAFAVGFTCALLLRGWLK